jgi:hypothetical protein
LKVADTPSESSTRLGCIRQVIFKIPRHLIFKMTGVCSRKNLFSRISPPKRQCRFGAVSSSAAVRAGPVGELLNGGGDPGAKCRRRRDRYQTRTPRRPCVAERFSIRVAARQISISGITPEKSHASSRTTFNTHIAWLVHLRVKAAAMAAILTAEDIVRRIAAECAYVDERGGVGIRLEPFCLSRFSMSAVTYSGVYTDSSWSPQPFTVRPLRRTDRPRAPCRTANRPDPLGGS